MFELVEAYNLENSIDSEIKMTASNLGKYLNFDTWKIIMFTKDKSQALIRYSSGDNINESHDSQSKICFDESKQDSYLNLILEEKKIVLHRCDDDKISKYRPVSKDALVELYFPLFLTNDTKKEIFGCLYFSKNNYLIDNISALLTDKYVTSQVINIQRDFESIYIEYIDNTNFLNLIHILSEINRKREPYMNTHPYNVALLSNLIGQELGFSEKQLYRLYIAAILHDVGKFYLSEDILNKPGKLIEIEKSIMKRHPIHSYDIVKDLVCGINKLSGIEDIVLQHHERYDGAGYPNGLKGEDILLESRILAIADSVDAMLSKRSYKKPKSIDKVINELIINKGKQFDPQLAQIMINILMNKQKNQEIILTEPVVIGTLVLLTKDISCQIQGTLIKTISGYKFKADCDECLCEKCMACMPSIISATFCTESNGKIFEYDTHIRYKANGKMYLSHLEPKATSDYFSLLWELDGNIAFKNSITSEVIINKIGGDFLSFYVHKNQFKDINIFNNVNTITIKFEDNNAITVPGKVTRTIKVGHKIYCDFKYINILESTRDQIFKQIFKKQAEFRKNIFSAMIE